MVLLSKNNKNDLELFDRTAEFSEDIIDVLKEIKDTSINYPLKSQLVRSAISIGVNYMEAEDLVSSKKDYLHKLRMCRKESKETIYWIRLLAHANPDFRNVLKSYYNEAKDLMLIFSKIISDNKSNFL